MLESVKAIIKAGAELEAKSSVGTPLEIAKQAGHDAVAHYLILRGARHVIDAEEGSAPKSG